jgi:phosphate transport system permease protein
LDSTSRFINVAKQVGDLGSSGELEEHESYPEDVALMHLRSGSQILAVPVSVRMGNELQAISSLPAALREVDILRKKSDMLLNTRIADLNGQLKSLDTRDNSDSERRQLTEQYQQARELLGEMQTCMSSFGLDIKDASGLVHGIPLMDVESYHFINQYGAWDKLRYFLSAAWDFISESPKQLYASGGVFPAIVGTVVMVLLMTLFVTPLGVLVAIYLHEYATQNRLTTLIRISVNNLAGVPSIVYGVFGLSFFVYELGAGIDNLFYSDVLPAPTFGAPGLFWASLTMAMLTLPVVVVATEEGLRRVPDSLRMGSYALGATQFEMIRKTVIPMASPGIMTGIILAIARGAGEVAPLILVGAVKFAPTLPIDAEYPFVHFERQFMHLGVTIFDGAFQGQLTGSGSNAMFAACLFLLLIVLILNIFAINIRHRLRRQYITLEE